MLLFCVFVFPFIAHPRVPFAHTPTASRFATDRWTARTERSSGRTTGRGFFDLDGSGTESDEEAAMADGALGGECGNAAMEERLREIAQDDTTRYDEDREMRRNAKRVAKWLEFAREQVGGRGGPCCEFFFFYFDNIQTSHHNANLHTNASPFTKSTGPRRAEHS
jgi:hypothetical protein